MAFSLLLTVLLTSTIVATATATATTPYTPASAPICKEKTANLIFYYREIFGGPNATAKVVIPPPKNNSDFGQTTVIDSELREGPEATSKLIGRAQGFAVGSSMQIPTIYITYNYVFIKGEYSGSTLVLVGRAVVGKPRLELSIIGGTAKFLMARGYVVYKAVTPPPPVGTVTPAGTFVYQIKAQVLHC